MVSLLRRLWDGTHTTCIRQSPPVSAGAMIHSDVYRCDTDEAQYRAAALALIQSSLIDLGYQYFNMCVPKSFLRTIM